MLWRSLFARLSFRRSPSPPVELGPLPSHEEDDEHKHYSKRSPWLRAGVLGAMDGLTSVAGLIIGVEGGAANRKSTVLAGVSGFVAGALSMAISEYVSMSSQRDAEERDVELERAEQARGPEACARELVELAGLYEARGLPPALAREVAERLTEVDVVRAHARDELGLDMDSLASPLLAAVTSLLAFSAGAALPLLASSFIDDNDTRLGACIAASAVGYVVVGGASAVLGGARVAAGAARVTIGGLLELGVTYAIGYAIGHSSS